MTRMHRRTALFALAALAMVSAAPAQAQIKGLEIIAPANPGSGFDQTSRAVRDALMEAGLATNIQVLNVPGAGGTIGLAQLVSGQKRGPTLLTIGATTVGAILANKPPVTLEDAAPVALLLKEYSMLVVPANSDIKTMADLSAKLKANPASVTWAVGSAGGIDHIIAGQVTKAVSGDASKTNAINYAGGGEQIASILGGHVTVGVGGVPEFASQIESGKLRAIAVSSPERLEGLDVPTLKEQGVDVAYGTWRGLMTTKKASEAEMKELGDAIRKMVETKAWKASLERYGWIPAYEPSDGYAAFLKGEQDMMRTALGELGLLK
ncbi:Bug family tripartite tricarboxylate transporter substrate binding protein [Microvirga makkahensis]|uniref:Tripartite tricarboxylate transporter substrate binding protein n=1 Tax=Microvirga makkahensis TaxID=1128670 RepID=A0A7X3SQH7_9HYPH|nr:tripartite tricarboxylate transporter substrate-binding protein [Microvirga makkahensis]MXQ13099.1 tripartite tricarboxylate transporter substrate binding protein [Microvirga makkahensis]